MRFRAAALRAQYGHVLESAPLQGLSRSALPLDAGAGSSECHSSPETSPRRFWGVMRSRYRRYLPTRWQGDQRIATQHLRAGCYLQVHRSEKDLESAVLERRLLTNKDVYIFSLQNGLLSSHARVALNQMIKESKLPSQVFRISYDAWTKPNTEPIKHFERVHP